MITETFAYRYEYNYIIARLISHTVLFFRPAVERSNRLSLIHCNGEMVSLTKVLYSRFCFLERGKRYTSQATANQGQTSLHLYTSGTPGYLSGHKAMDMCP